MRVLSHRWGVAAALLWFAACAVEAQTLSFSNHRKYEPPDYWTFRLGPFYSNVRFSQSAGYRWTRTSDTNTAYVFQNETREITKDGSEFPLVSTLTFRNYLLISDSMDLDASVTLKYAHYPMETQEDEFTVNFAEEGLVGDLSTDFEITPTVRMMVYDRPVYRTDYVDTRGISDRYGGSRFRQFQNTAGANIDWLIGDISDAGFSVRREDLVPQEKGSFADQERTTWAGQAFYELMLNDAMGMMTGVRAGWSQNTYPSTNRTETSALDYGVFLTAQVTEKTKMQVSAGYSQGFLDKTNGTEKATDTEGTWTAQAQATTDFATNVQQALSFSRSQKAGFNSPFEINTSYGYLLTWTEELCRTRLQSTMSTVEPNGRKNVNGYSDWTTTLSLAIPLVQDFMTLDLSSTYTERRNEETDSASGSAEWQADYSTWVHKVGTSFKVWEDIDFSTTYNHMERRSAQDTRLAYSRDVFEATLTYSYEF